MIEEMIRGMIVIGIAVGVTIALLGYIAIMVKLAEMGHRTIALLINGISIVILLLVLSYIIGCAVSW